MNKKLLKTLAIAACSVTFAASVGFGVAEVLTNAPGAANAAEITLDATWLDERDYGSLFTVPMGDIDGNRADRFVVITPSGKAYTLEKLTLDEVGEYAVTWYSKVEGKDVSVEKKFNVSKRTISLSGDATLTASNKSAYPYAPEGSVRLTLTDGASFTYNKPVDLTKFSSSQSFIKVYPEKGVTNIDKALSKNQYSLTEDAATYYITLTDCYDPENYATIEMSWSDSSYYWALNAGAAGQKAHSLKKTSKGNLNIGDSNDFYNVAFAPNVGYNRANMSQKGIELFYDAATNRLKAKTTRMAALATETTPADIRSETRLFADLSNELIYPDNAFKGFTTGEVFISITATNFAANGKANINISSFAGEKLSLNLLEEKVANTTAPTIQLEDDLTKFNKIVKGEEISVPQALALDTELPYGTLATAKVYYGRNGSYKGTAVNVTKDGKFTPNQTGKYTIVYTAKDYAGNTSEKVEDLMCVDTYTQAVSLALSETAFEVDAGSIWEIPACTVSSLYEDASDVKVYVDGKLLEGNELFLEDVKTYVVTYAYETPFKTYTVECEVNAMPTDMVVFSNPVLPNYFIANAKYTLDSVVAKVYSSSTPVSSVAQAYMKVDNGAYTAINVKKVEIPANASKVQFKYEANGSSIETEAIKVVNVGYGGALQKKNYFQSTDSTFTSEANTSGITYTMASGSTMDYVNVVSMNKFAINYKTNNVDAMKFTFVDYYDKDKKVTLELRNEEGGVQYLVNDISVKFVKESTLTNVDVTARYYNGFEVTLNKTPVGPFDFENTFASDRVELSVTVEGVDGADCGLTISKMYGSKFTSGTKEDSEPFIIAPVDHQGYYKVGDSVLVAKPSITDLYSPFLEENLTLEVMTPNGSYVKVDGITLDGTCPVDRDYTIKFTELGDYDVLFFYKDQIDDSEVIGDGYTCMVRDSKAPTLIVSGRTQGEMISGEYLTNITIATYTVSDDVTNASDIVTWSYVCYPSGLLKEIEGGKSFEAREKGIYYVTYMAWDEFGNYASFYYMIQVS